ncbi:MAG TPA: Fe-S cluster assembly ATPase SufC [Anaerolineae bacterium]|nr:Fe-S cluster assembly ATPase SufC [Anaerolineae bacterium]
MGDVLEIRGLRVKVEDKEILKGVDLTVALGEVHALMGPNGSGKSTLAYSLLGHPGYTVTDGEVIWKGQNMLELSPDERSRAGLFLAFQYPVSIPGVTVANFLRTALNARLKASEVAQVGPLMATQAAGKSKGISIPEFRRLLLAKMKMLGMDPAFAGRYLNDGFSGGEKKRNEILQMALLEPQIAILDETDSGLDIDALKIVAEGVNRLLGPNMGALVITHYQRLLDYIKADRISILFEGRVVVTGGPELALELERTGYDHIRETFGAKAAA